MDLKKAENAMKAFLKALDQDLTDPNLKNTPERVTRMFAEEILGGKYEEPTIFKTEKVGTQFVVVRDIIVRSMCSHHLMPIVGVAHVGAFFLPDETKMHTITNLPGLSKYARIVEAFSQRLQLQERLTAQVAEAIELDCGADFVVVIVDAKHMCMTHRGVKHGNSSTMTDAVRQSHIFQQQTKFKAEELYNQFLLKLQMPRVVT